MIQREGVGIGIEGEIIHPIASCKGAAKRTHSSEDRVVITGSEVDVAEIGEGGAIGRARIGPGDGHDIAVGIKGEAVALPTRTAATTLDGSESCVTAATPTTAIGDDERTIIANTDREGVINDEGVGTSPTIEDAAETTTSCNGDGVIAALEIDVLDAGEADLIEGAAIQPGEGKSVGRGIAVQTIKSIVTIQGERCSRAGGIGESGGVCCRAEVDGIEQRAGLGATRCCGAKADAIDAARCRGSDQQGVFCRRIGDRHVVGGRGGLATI